MKPNNLILSYRGVGACGMPGLRWGGNRPLSRQCVHLLCVAVAAGAKASATASAERDETVHSPSPSPTLHVSTSLSAPNAARARPARRTAAARRLRRRSIRAVTQCSVFSVQWRRRGGVVLWREATGEWPRSVRRHVGRRRVGRRRVGRHVEWPCPQARQMDDEGGEDGPRAWAC